MAVIRSRRRRRLGMAAVVAVLVAAALGIWWVSDGTDRQTSHPRGLTCGTFEFPQCSGPDNQFDPTFMADAGGGGFGGGDCDANRTPVIFVHGNADRAINWDSEITGAVGDYPEIQRSVYDEFAQRGYTGCELFGITYLTEAEQESPLRNYHEAEKYRIILDFVQRVKDFTGQPQVDIVAHSLGVSMTMAALTWHDDTVGGVGGWDDVRRFVNIAGAIRGLASCRAVGFANPAVSTCGSQNLVDPFVFGFYPDAGTGPGRNDWTAATGERSLRTMPAAHPGVDFYTIHAGQNDHVHCRLAESLAECAESALFDDAPNVRAQLDVGAGSIGWDQEADMAEESRDADRGGDTDGVGHIKARNNAGAIVYEMVNADCADLACQGAYDGGPVTTE